MFIKKDAINQKNIDKLLDLHTTQVNNYLNSFLIPDFVAFYLGSGYYKSCLFEESFDVYIKSIFEFFNINLKITNKLKNAIKEQLLIKFSLKIINENPLEFEVI